MADPINLRRIVTVPGFLLAWILWVAGLPVWLLLGFATDLVRWGRGAVVVRSIGVITSYLTAEVVGIGCAAGLWAAKPFLSGDERWQALHFRLQAGWGTFLFHALRRCFSLRVEVDGVDRLGDGPYLLLLRHCSTADTLLAAALLSQPTGIRLRYVLKRELLWDPCLDIVGNRLPNVFVDRNSDDSQAEVNRIGSLATDLGQRDALLIYPEGTRFSESRRAHLIERFATKGDTAMVEYTTSLRHVLPPRPGGTLALLDAAPTLDVVICAHSGFEGVRSLSALWNGELVRRHVRVHFERVSRDQLPATRDAQAAWLMERWRWIDAWVEDRRSA